MKNITKTNEVENKLEEEYNNFLLKLEETLKEDKKVVYLDELSYSLHLKLIEENYKIRKIIKTTFKFGFIRQKKKLYCVLLNK